MIFLAPFLVQVAFLFGPAEICSLMLLGLLAGSTLAKGAPVKGIAMTLLGLVLGLVGMDVNTGAERFTFGQVHLSTGIDIVAIALGLFGVAEWDVLHRQANAERDPLPGQTQTPSQLCL